MLSFTLADPDERLAELNTGGVGDIEKGKDTPSLICQT